MVLTFDQIATVAKKVVDYNNSDSRKYDLHMNISTGISEDTSVRIIVYNRYIPNAESHTSSIYGSIQCDSLYCSATFEQMMEFIDKYANEKED